MKAPTMTHPGAPALARGLTILDYLAAQSGEASFTELVRHLNISKPSLSRLLHELIARRYVSKQPETGHYCLGYRLLAIGTVAAQRLRIRDEVRPSMRALVERCGETVELTVMDEGEFMFAEKLDSPDSILLTARVGLRIGYFHAVAIGKVWLAYMSAAERRAHFARFGMDARTRHTVTDPAVLAAQLAAVRRNGFATDHEEARLGVFRMAAPLFDHSGQVRAVLSIAGPMFRLSEEREAELAARLLEAAQEISAHLGYGRP
jgi:DNA-binding IclR family transcriptional regulator